jgi:hypothetical protein
MWGQINENYKAHMHCAIKFKSPKTWWIYLTTKLQNMECYKVIYINIKSCLLHWTVLFQPHVFTHTFLASCSCLKNNKYTTLSGKKHHWRKNVLKGYHIRSTRGCVHQPMWYLLIPQLLHLWRLMTCPFSILTSNWRYSNRRGPWCLWISTWREYAYETPLWFVVQGQI